MSEVDPREMALRVVRDALETQVELMVALQYCGMLVPDALAPLREHDPNTQLVERILSVPPAPEPTYARRVRRPAPGTTHTYRVPVPQTLVGVEYGRGRTRTKAGERSLFSQWMEGEIPWHPSVMGWADDDERARGFVE